MTRLTEDVPGTGGAIRVEVDDFVVEELPLYGPSGSGEHVMFEVEKRGVSTREAVRRLARALGVGPEAFGFAGQKDSRAVARQRLTVAGVDAARVAGVEARGVRVLSTAPHGKKLRLGHLRGNRFRVRIRDVDVDVDVDVKDGARAHAEATLAMLSGRGVPNRFGPQRFGDRGDGHLVGEALVKGDEEQVLSLMLGRPRETDRPALRRSREAYEAGDFRAALGALPPSRRDERACLAALARGESPRRAIRKIAKRARLFLISALQSRLFNQVLDARMPAIDRVERGDLAYKHDSGAVFLVEDAEAEGPRAEAFEISPSGPMFGYRMAEPRGRPAEAERAVLDAAGLTLDSFRKPGGLKSRGARRALRSPLTEHALEREGADLWVSFTLPPGSYATVVLDEIMKTDA